MPIKPVSSDNVTITFSKNHRNLLDSMWYGTLYQEMLFINSNVEELDEYSDEDKKAMGFSEEANDATVRDIYREIIRTHMPEPSLSSFKNVIADVYRANNRVVMEDIARYR